MPTSEQILATLTAIANEWVAVAIAWHVVIALALAAIALGWRPTHRAVALFVALLPASVAGFAIAYGNPFNGVVFVATSLALVALAVTDTRGRVGAVPRWSVATGAAMVAFAWVYPHFLAGSPLQYLYAAPVGLVPCPSLSMAIGLTLLAGGGGRRAWRMTLAAVGLFYGVYGVARLGVALDVVLLTGAALLGASALAPVLGRSATARTITQSR